MVVTKSMYEGYIVIISHLITTPVIFGLSEYSLMTCIF